MTSDFSDRLASAPDTRQRDDLWARMCCEQALVAYERGCYPVGAVLVNQANERVCLGRNRVFEQGYHSHRHAEMELLDQLESDYPELDRSGLVLYVSLEPCLMCVGRILLSGIRTVRYLVADPVGGFTRGFHFLPPVWRELQSGTNFSLADTDSFWPTLAHQLVVANADQMRGKTVAAWKGVVSGSD